MKILLLVQIDAQDGIELYSEVMVLRVRVELFNNQGAFYA
jgi:hypothetical protein